MTTSRTDFNNTWLCEMPMGTGKQNTYPILVNIIKDYTSYGTPVTQLSNGLNKLEGSSFKIYWYGDIDNIILGSELHIKDQGLVISITGKNPNYKGKPPYASELYSNILDDNPQSLRVLSDEQLSDEGYSLWKNMLKNGYYISVYDKESPGISFETLHNDIEFDTYFKKHDPSFKRYQYVLSNKKTIAETRNHFHIRRYRELCGLSLDDYIPKNNTGE